MTRKTRWCRWRRSSTSSARQDQRRAQDLLRRLDDRDYRQDPRRRRRAERRQSPPRSVPPEWNYSMEQRIPVLDNPQAASKEPKTALRGCAGRIVEGAQGLRADSPRRELSATRSPELGALEVSAPQRLPAPLSGSFIREAAGHPARLERAADLGCADDRCSHARQALTRLRMLVRYACACNVSGAMSAPLGHTIVPASESARRRAK